MKFACTRCATPLPASGSHAECGRCQRHPPTFERSLALFRYQFPVDKLVLQLKFRRELSLARLFGELMVARVQSRPARTPDVIVPVPLHRSRLRERGYNQALEIARTVGAQLRLPVDAHGVRRARDTRAQSDLSLRERRKNVRGAFVARGNFNGLRVAIIDDVMTSGSTAEALAKCLKNAGAREIEVWVVARA